MLCVQSNYIFSYDILIEKSIFNDDINIFEKRLLMDSYVLISSSLNPFHLFDDMKINLIEMAAFHGSIKCFKFFMLNGMDINEKITKYAIAGGNIEIIKILNSKGMIFNECLKICIAYHWHFIYDDIFKGSVLSEEILRMCTEFYNIPIFVYVIDVMKLEDLKAETFMKKCLS